MEEIDETGRSVQVQPIEEKVPKNENQEAYDAYIASILCAVCSLADRENELLLCDGEGCPVSMHMSCCRPPMTEIPPGVLIELFL